MRARPLLPFLTMAAIFGSAGLSEASSHAPADASAQPLAEAEPQAADEAFPEPGSYVVGPVAERVRQFRRAGDALVNGDPSAYEVRIALNAQLAGELAALPVKDWSERQNATSLVLYVLFGGDAGTLRAAAAAGTIYGPLKKCAAAVLAYADRDIEVAQQLLAELDRAALPNSILGPLSLVQGAIQLQKSPAEAVKLLEAARIALAGTAIEESALRQLLLAHLYAGQHKEAARVVSDYFRRFPSSLYADQFSDIAAQKLAAAGGDIEQVLITLCDKEMPAEAKRRHLQFLLNAAKHFLDGAKLQGARSMASYVKSHSDRTSLEYRRSELYELVLDAAIDKQAEALPQLAALDKGRFTHDEQETIEAAIAVARQVLDGVPDSGTAAVSPQASEAISNDGAAPAEALKKRVESVLKEAEKQLTKKN